MPPTERYLQMTTQPVGRLVGRLALPSMAMMLISTFYNLADTYFVGLLDTSAVAAVGISFALMSIIQAVGFLFGQGSGNYVARTLGKQEAENAAMMAATGFFSAFIAGIAIAALGQVFLTPLAHLLGATDTILPYAQDYLRYILFGAPFMISSYVLNNLLRYQGSATVAMVGTIGAAMLNIILDPLFIFALGMGVAGASFATMVSQVAGCTVLLFYGCTRKGNIRIRLANFRPTAARYKEMLRGGSPSLVRQGVASLATICLNQAAGPFGDAVIAAMAIVSRIMMIAGAAMMGFGQGFQPVCGFNYGAKLYGRVRQAFWFCIRVSAVGLVIAAVVGFIFAPDIVALFRKDDLAVIEVGALALRLQCLTLPLLGINVMSSMAMQVMGMAAKASLLAAARQGMFLIPLLLVLVPFFGVLGIQVSVPIAEALTAALSIPIITATFKNMGAAQ